MSNVFIHGRLENTFMKVQPVKIHTAAAKVIQPKKTTPVKDALIVSGYCSLPVIFYEAACRIAEKVNKKYDTGYKDGWIV